MNTSGSSKGEPKSKIRVDFRQLRAAIDSFPSAKVKLPIPVDIIVLSDIVHTDPKATLHCGTFDVDGKPEYLFIKTDLNNIYRGHCGYICVINRPKGIMLYTVLQRWQLFARNQEPSVWQLGAMFGLY